MKISKVLQVLEAKAPAGTAESWDNVGLLVGNSENETAGAVVSVDLTDEAIDLAKKNRWKLIVNHHPCIFPRQKGLGRVTTGQGASPSSQLVYRAIREGISVVSCHTNFDQCSLEVVQAVSRALGAKVSGRLIEAGEGQLLKLVVFVPRAHAEAVRAAVCAAGAGQISQYDECSFSVLGEGTFRGASDTTPFLGTPGVLERAEEVRLETILPSGLEKRVIAALLEAHPYEEVAYDLYALQQQARGKGATFGLGYGFFGDLEKPCSFGVFAQRIRKAFGVNAFLASEPRPKQVRRVAFAAGKGASFIGAAAQAGCDVFVTGEAGYHAQLEGARRGVTVVELGHRESERFYLSTMKSWLEELGLSAQSLDQPTQSIWVSKKS